MMTFILIHFISIGFTEENWDSIMKARSIDTLIAADMNLKIKNEQNKRCLLEKQNDWFPENCLFLLEQDLEDLKNFKNLEKINEDLTKSCIKNARKVLSITKINSFLSNSKFSMDCQKALERQKLDIEYSGGTYFEKE